MPTMIDTQTHAQDYWSTFPESYRAEQVATLARWLKVGESGVVIGGSGTGKSNLVGFLLSRPDLICQPLGLPQSDFLFLHLDINGLPAITTPYFYRAMLDALEQAASQLSPEIDQQMSKVTNRISNWEDSLALYFALQQAHELLISRAGKRVVWLLDRFDAACQRLEAGTLNSLRKLRDHSRLRGKLSYLVFTRHALRRLRNPTEYDEFHEIMVGNTCWIGPMNERDGRWITRQMAERHEQTFSDQDETQLICLTGGLPAYLKAACSELAKGTIHSGEKASAWCDLLWNVPIFLRNSEEMWNDCTEEEQRTLTSVSMGWMQSSLDQAAVTELSNNGLLVQEAKDTKKENGKENGKENSKGNLRIFSPLFAKFIQNRQPVTTQGILSLDAKSGMLLRDGEPTSVQTTALEQRLLEYLVKHVAVVCEKDELITHIWPDEKLMQGIRDDSLAQLVRRLREKLRPCQPQHEYIQAAHGRGYRLVQPG